MWYRRCQRSAFLLAWGLLCAAGAAAGAQTPTDPAALDKLVSDALRDMHNRAADLFNNTRDYNGSYRMFQGGLYMARPLVAHRADVQKLLDDGLAEAERLASVPERALRLHKAIEDMRAKLKPAAAKPPESPAPMPMPMGTPPSPLAPGTPPVKPPDGPAFPPPPAAPLTLWKRLGGEENVRRIVEDFVTLVIIDPKVDFARNNKFKFTEAKEAELKARLAAFISSVTEGTLAYTGRPMAEVHKDM